MHTIANTGPTGDTAFVRSSEGDLAKRVGSNVRRIREARGMSQDDLAQVIGSHRAAVGRLERGERNVTHRTVERIAEWLGINLMRLFEPVD